MLTNNSILVQLYYYSSSTSHIQAISLRAYSHVLIVHHTYGRAKAERVYLTYTYCIPNGVSTSTDVPRTRARYLTTSYSPRRQNAPSRGQSALL
jgi:hypothetical protein